MLVDLSLPGNARLRVVLVIACAVLLVDCASSGSRGAASGGSFDVLTAEQIQETSANNLWDAIRTLRPRWLRTRGRTSIIGQGPDEPVVYVSGTRYGSLSALRQMNVNQVRRVEFVDPLDATTRFGTGHAGGAILVDLGGN